MSRNRFVYGEQGVAGLGVCAFAHAVTLTSWKDQATFYYDPVCEKQSGLAFRVDDEIAADFIELARQHGCIVLQ